jgi:hypothetical protein
MEKETPKDKLLKACGVPSVPGQDQVSRKQLEAFLKQAETASSWAQQAQDETDKNYRRLNAYIRDELPGHLVKAFEEVEANRVAGSLRPLDNSVSNAAARINSCAEELAGISWDWRLLMHTAMMGMFTVVITGGLVRYSFFGDKIDEAKRYEVYGRKVVANIERYSSKDQEKLYKWIGGRP